MIVKIGNYSFQANESGISIQKRGLVGDTGLVYAWEHTWRLSGRLIRDTLSELEDAIRGLEDACRRISVGLDQGDCAILFDDGNRTEHYIRYRDTLNGIRLTQPPSYPISEGAEYVTYRSFEMTIQAELGFAALGVGGVVNSEVVSWMETITIEGGHPLIVDLVLINGPPVQQEVSPQVPWIGIQSGEAVGRTGYLTPPKPVFVGAAIQRDAKTQMTPAEQNAGAFAQASRYPTRWEYRVTSPSPLFGQPTPRRQ